VNQFDEEGRKTGRWEEADPHGGTVSGHYLAGERTGLWQHRFADGELRSEFRYEAGELNGDSIWYRQTGGLLQKGGFLNGEKHGRWQRWTAAGVPLDEGTFDHGVKSGPWTSFSPDGSIKKTVNHRARRA
jgi:antitoxin component YwqK of YwqJK toxin-antitoxin module